MQNQQQQQGNPTGGGVHVVNDMARQSMRSFAQEFPEEELSQPASSVGGDTAEDTPMRTPSLGLTSLELQNAKKIASEDNKKEGVLVSGPPKVLGEKIKEYKKNGKIKQSVAKQDFQQPASIAEAASFTDDITEKGQGNDEKILMANAYGDNIVKFATKGKKKGRIAETEGLKLATTSTSTVATSQPIDVKVRSGKTSRLNKLGKVGQGARKNSRWTRKMDGNQNSHATSSMGVPAVEAPPTVGPSPGAYRIAGIGDEEDYVGSNDNDTNTSVTAGSTTVASTAQVSTITTTAQPDADFVVPIARTVEESMVFEAVPDDRIKSRQRRIMLAIVSGVLVIVAVILAVVFGLNGSDSSAAALPEPTQSPTMNSALFLERGTGIVGDQPGDEAGIAVAMNSNGTVLAIAALLHDGENGTDSGHVRVFTWLNETTEWVQQGASIDGEDAGDHSGTAVALSSDGTILAVGAFKNDGIGEFEIGHCRVHKWNGAEWMQIGRDLDGEASNDRSGFSVALSSDGTVVAIGGPANSNPSPNGWYAGHARVYRFDSEATNDWVQVGEDIDGEDVGDTSGESVTLSSDGQIIAIGAFRNDGEDQQFNDAGHVRVFQWSSAIGDGQWLQRGADIDGEEAGDEAGTSPAVVLTPDGNTLAIASSMHNSPKGLAAGHVRVFDWSINADDWIQRGGGIDGEAGDESGSAVAISGDGNMLVIGSLLNRNNGVNAGTTRIFAWKGSDWIQIGEDLDGEAVGDLSGVTVAMSNDGSVISVGSPLNDRNNRTNAGLVRIYDLFE